MRNNQPSHHDYLTHLHDPSGENENISLHHQNWRDRSRDDWYGPRATMCEEEETLHSITSFQNLKSLRSSLLRILRGNSVVPLMVISLMISSGVGMGF
ncbi:hypothetical protein Tco_0981352 [Tanacetum coccineum]